MERQKISTLLEPTIKTYYLSIYKILCAKNEYDLQMNKIYINIKEKLLLQIFATIESLKMNLLVIELRFVFRWNAGRFVQSQFQMHLHIVHLEFAFAGVSFFE